MDIRISPTFLDSFRYYMGAVDEHKDSARQSILDRLRGVSAPNAYMQRGIDFEAMVSRQCDNAGKAIEIPDSIAEIVKTEAQADALRNVVHKMTRFVKNALRQVFIEFELVRGVTMIGYIDFLHRNTIFDVKTTSRYTEADFPKYGDGAQHKAYLAALHGQGIEHFRYLITDWETFYAEDYYWTPRYLDELRGEYNAFVDYLRIDDEMREAWEFKQKAQKEAA